MIVARNLAILQRPEEIEDGYRVSHSQDGRACSGENVQDLKLRRICMIAARHAEIAEEKLWKERQVEAD
jgi:hypothetical protein